MEPWESEPDRLDFDADGLRCIAKRNGLGAWCGYVGIAKDHPWFGLPYDTLIKPTSDMLEDRSLDDMGAVDLFLNALSGKDSNEELPIGTALRVHASRSATSSTTACSITASTAPMPVISCQG